MKLAQQFYNTVDLRRHAEGYTHYFDASTMRFFNSRVGGNAYPCPNHPYKTVFVTSERCDWADRVEDQVTVKVYDFGGVHFAGLVTQKVFRGDPRLYSVRVYDCRDHSIDTVGDFQQYGSSRAANKAAREAALTIAATVEDWHDYALELNLEYDQDKRRAMSRGDQGFAIYGIGATNNWVAI